mmetsp:Transcript_5878/g.14122  ORF Transcript_5878/g.14122 Transcript_5878/m.14122 type:complete len:238 (+) Transcript_5878:566-1279(+)
MSINDLPVSHTPPLTLHTVRSLQNPASSDLRRPSTVAHQVAARLEPGVVAKIHCKPTVRNPELITNHTPLEDVLWLDKLSPHPLSTHDSQRPCQHLDPARQAGVDEARACRRRRTAVLRMFLEVLIWSHNTASGAEVVENPVCVSDALKVALHHLVDILIVDLRHISEHIQIQVFIFLRNTLRSCTINCTFLILALRRSEILERPDAEIIIIHGSARLFRRLGRCLLPSQRKIWLAH